MKAFWIAVLVGLTFICPLSGQTQNGNLFGWYATMEGISTSNGVSLAKVIRIPLPGILGGATIVIPQVEFSDESHVNSSGIGKGPIEIRSTNGFRILADEYQLTKGGLVLGGKVFLPDTLGNIDISFSLGELSLRSDGALVGKLTVKSVDFRFGQYPVSGMGVAFGYHGVSFADSRVVIPAVPQGLSLGPLLFLADGSLVESRGSFEQVDFTINNIKVTASNTAFATDEQGEGYIRLDGALYLPPPFNAGNQTYSDMVLTQNGIIYKGMDIISKGLNFELGGFGFRADHIGNFSSERGCQAEGIVIQFPDTLGDARMRFEDLGFGTDGKINSYGFSCDKFNLVGFQIDLKEIGFDSEGFWAKNGAIYIPKTFPGELAGQVVPLDSLRIDLQGKIKTFEIHLYNDSEFMINQNMYLDRPKMEIMKDLKSGNYRMVISGSITLPQAIGDDLYSIPVSQLPLDLKGNRFIPEEMQVAPLHFSAGGLALDLVEQETSPRFDMKFSGKASIVNSTVFKSPDDFTGTELTVDSLLLNSDGTLGAAIFSLPEKHAQSYWATLESNIWKLLPYVQSPHP